MVRKEMKGAAFLFSETGTEGGWWAMQEDGFLSEDGVHWSYEGVRELEEGDDFTVFADDGSVLWHGIIHQNTTTELIPRQVVRNDKLVNHQTWKQQIAGGMWVHWVQAGIDPVAWGELFVGNKRCLLKRSFPACTLNDRAGELTVRPQSHGRRTSPNMNSDDYADWLLAQRGSVNKDLDLEF